MNVWLGRLRASGARTIVEFGCGDWSTTKYLELSEFESYTGIDIVPELIDENRKRWGSARTKFVCADVVNDRSPKADIVIVKDVFQHLSNHSIQKILERMKDLYHYAVITNDIKRQQRRWRKLPFFWTSMEKGRLNGDIPDGGSRPLDLGRQPFSLTAIDRLRFVAQLDDPRVQYVKEVLIVDQQSIPKHRG